MFCYRLSREKFAAPLSGKGAALKGGRWNSPGTELIYSAENRSLPMAEVAVHFSISTLPDDFVMLTLEIPDELSLTGIMPETLPNGWNTFPPPLFCQKIGDQFVADCRFCLLKVPSAVTRGDFNILINPGHPEFSRIRILKTEKFPFDRRLFADDLV
ncbi:MAG: RES family NAD+ phosphorylase [Bacteroidetes bacterium]|nr:RES family NAD+ phosphorylase [Bacteroidota bacterium]